MQHSKEARILLVGKRNSKVKRVERILKKYAPGTEVVLGTAYPTEPFEMDSFNLIVLTDTLEEKAVSDFMSGVRQLFPGAKVLGIFDEIDPEIEINMRSAGLIFLGSYEHFIRASGDILKSAFGSKKLSGRR